MANRNIFASSGGPQVPQTDSKNMAGGTAYKMSRNHALAQYACTGCFNGTYYASAKDQFDTVRQLVNGVDSEFVAKTALYARNEGFMKDMPAYLCAELAVRDPEMLKRVFYRCINNGKMLRNFAQILRSGALGRNSFGSVAKRLMQGWFEQKSPYNIFTNSIGNDPSLVDVMRMCHPKPNTPEKAAMFAYLMGAEREGDKLIVRGRDRHTGEVRVFYEHDYDALPREVQEFEAYKASRDGDLPDVPFQMLDSLELGKNEWAQLAATMTWTQTRMNLNTLHRHGVFENQFMVDMIAERIRNPELIKRTGVFPYQLMMAYQMTTNVPHDVREALQDAMDTSLENVPPLGTVYVCVDVSGSMGQAITGNRGRIRSSSVRCVDVAALYASAILRTNRSAKVIPFAGDVVNLNLNPRDSVVTNAQRLAACYGGSTNCSAPLRMLNHQRAKGDAVVYVSDFESWVDSRNIGWGGFARSANTSGTAMLNEWNQFHARNPNSKMVCVDLVPNATAQVTERPNILQVGGFSDRVFDVISSFVQGGSGDNYWVELINSVEI